MTDASLQAYRDYRAEIAGETIVPTLRAAIVMVVVVSAGFIPLDWLAFPDAFNDVLAVRVVFGASFACLWFLAARSPERTMVAAVFGEAIHLIGVIAATDGVSGSYYPGILMLLLGAPILVPLNAKQAFALAASVVLGFGLIPAFGSGGFNLRDYAISMSFVSGSAVVTVAGSLFLDRLRFAAYLRRAEIAAARDELAKMDEIKTRFSANVHHELRTPLTLMLAPLEGLRAGDYGQVSERIAETFRTMHVNGQRLLKLINDLLDLAKLESKQFEIRRAPVEIDELIENIVVGARPMAERKGISLHASAPSPPPPLFADADALEKVLVNLLGNALKFTDSGGTVEIGASAVENGLELWVRDSGIGLAPDQLDRIFDRFAQVDSSATRKHEGTGIGLSLTQELVALHRGEIWAESDGVGHGSTIKFFLPTGESDSEIEEALIATNDGSGVVASESLDAARNDLEDTQDRRVLAAEGENEPAALQFVDLDRSVQRWEDQRSRTSDNASDAEDIRPEILVADDNTDMRELVSFILGKDFRVRSARNGREALDFVQDFLPDLVVSDIMMPEMSGIELCAAIKSDERLAQVPVMLVSSKAESEMKIQGLEHGADDYVTKPFHPRELLARARSHAALHRARRDLAAQNEALSKALDDLQRAEAQIIQSERLAAVGEIAAGIAHEVNNPVNYALNAARSLTASISEVSSIAEHAAALEWQDLAVLEREIAKLREEVEQAGGPQLAESISELTEIVTNGLERTRKLVGDLRDFAVPARPSDDLDIDLVESIDSALLLVRPEIERAGTRIDWIPPDDLPNIAGHPTEISQVVLNLVKNAAESIGAARGRIMLSTRVDRDFVVLKVEDDGPGIPDEALSRVFEPFFTTKSAGEGTGLGLAVCRKIVDAHGGKLTASNSPASGAIFELALPIAQIYRAEGEGYADPGS